MKRFLDSFIFLLFLLVFLFQDIIASWIIPNLKEPQIDQSLQITYQNLLENYQKLSKENQIPEEKENRIYSKVMYRDPLEFFDIITIYKGKEEGVKEQSAVLNQDGLLGIVIKTSNHLSKVRLLTNQDTSISVKIKDSYGILQANNQKECWIHNLTKEIEIEIGDKITTSGLTEIPGNILVGTVEEIQKDELGLIQSVKVKKASDLNEIVYVTILQKDI